MPSYTGCLGSGSPSSAGCLGSGLHFFVEGVWGLACILLEGVWGLACLLVGAWIFGCLGFGLCLFKYNSNITRFESGKLETLTTTELLNTDL